MRRGFPGLSAQVDQVLKADPYCGHLFAFRGRRGDMVKILWWDGQGACLFSKRLERGRFVWPAAEDGKVKLTAAQLSMLLEGLDWRAPRRTWATALGRLKNIPDYVPSSASGGQAALARVQAAAGRPRGWIDRRCARFSDLPTAIGHRVRARAELGT